MGNFNNIEFWLEQEGPQGTNAVGNPSSDAFTGATSVPGIANAAGGEDLDFEQDPNAKNQGDPNQGDEDLSLDPETPDMPEVSEEQDFEVWKREFFELAVKADTNEMIDAIHQVRDRELTPTQRKFVEDNMQILLLRQDANIDKASKEIRKLISQDMDQNSPATALLRHLNATLATYPFLNNIFIKLIGTYGMKSDLHRKYVSALFGSIQVGGGGIKEDLIYSESEYSINISTRFYTEYSNISLGRWALQEDDPEKYLSNSELDRLQEGSPEERRVLRRRVVLESIAERFKDRAFLIHVSDPETGNISSLAWDISDSLREGYKQGKFVVRKRKGVDANAMIDDDGSITPLFNLSIYYLRDTGDTDERGNPITSEEPFLEEREGMLYLNAIEDIIKEAGSGMSGMLYMETPYQGNPSDMLALMRCTPSCAEIVLRRC